MYLQSEKMNYEKVILEMLERIKALEEWIGNKDENFYKDVQSVLIDAIKRIKDVTENIAIIKPYSFTLIGEDHETIADLYLVDDDTILISGDLMKGLGEDLENFWQELEHQD